MIPLRIALTALFCLLLVGCQPDPSEPDAANRTEPARDDAPAPDSPEALADAVGQMFGGEDGERRRVEPVDFRVLRDLLPDEAAGLARADVGGEKTGMAGFTISRAEADYRGEDDPNRRIELQITDAGGIGQMAMLGAAWMHVEVDRESNSGYERTTEFEGYPAYEKVQSGDRPRSELQVVVEDRFFVSAEGQGVEMDEVKDALREMDLRALAAMRDEGVER